ncbi:MAG TPA: OsmC family protein [Puia sp.]|nr:OsmC family protein [Puia sp.]
MDKEHRYMSHLRWTGNKGAGTADYRAYDRDHVLSAPGKPEIPGSSDPTFRGNPQRYNPEELLVSSLSSCHMLWYLHLAAINGVVVTAYEDNAEGTMVEAPDGGGHFRLVVLHPIVTVIDPSMAEKAMALHHDAHKLCFIASSMNFPVEHQPQIRTSAE